MELLNSKMQISLNCRGKLLSLQKPLIMGILNITPDSFSDAGKYNSLEKALAQTENMLNEGAEIIDIGAYSSRPHAKNITIAEETQRIEKILPKLVEKFPDSVFSIDTFRSEVAKSALEIGTQIINDISGGVLDEKMHSVLASFGNVPYILMHMQGNPQNMQDNPINTNAFEIVWQFFVKQINLAREAGIKDIVLDLGFGFGKTLKTNYELLNRMQDFKMFSLPILSGTSRKSMISKLMETSWQENLAIGEILNYRALSSGANFLRVHDVGLAKKTIDFFVNEIDLFAEN